LLTGLPPEARRMAREGSNAVDKGEWHDPDDVRPTARRTAKNIVGYRQFCPLRRCLRRYGAASNIKIEHILAADLVRRRWDGARLGFSGVRDMLPVTSIIYLPKAGPTRLQHRQVSCWRSLRRIIKLFSDTEWTLLRRVVLENRTISNLCRTHGGCPKAMMQTLVRCLDRLVEHLDSEIDEGLKQGTLDSDFEWSRKAS
jgi:hypothetical protein